MIEIFLNSIILPGLYDKIFWEFALQCLLVDPWSAATYTHLYIIIIRDLKTLYTELAFDRLNIQ